VLHGMEHGDGQGTTISTVGPSTESSDLVPETSRELLGAGTLVSKSAASYICIWSLWYTGSSGRNNVEEVWVGGVVFSAKG
jgi:hypothetical protein